MQSVPSQSFQVTLDEQNCTLSVYQKSTGVYIDIYLENTLLLAGIVGQHGNRIIRDAYYGFLGDLIFWDTQGTSDPSYTGLGSRWILIYLLPSELPSTSTVTLTTQTGSVLDTSFILDESTLQ